MRYSCVSPLQFIISSDTRKKKTKVKRRKKEGKRKRKKIVEVATMTEFPYREKAARNAGRIGGDKSRWNLIGVPPPFDFTFTLFQSRRSALSVTLTLHSE